MPPLQPMDPAAARAIKRYLKAYAGRNSGPEFFNSFTTALTAPTTVRINQNLNLNRPLEALEIRISFRDVISVANMTVAAAESPQTILQQLTVSGIYKGTAYTPWKISGATTFAWPRLYRARGCTCTINGVRQQEPSQPFAQTLANFGNIGTYDIELVFTIPTYPIVSESNEAMDMLPYMWQPQDWADSIQIQLDLGDKTSFGTNAGGTVHTITGSGGTGLPLVEVFTRYVSLGTLRPGDVFQTALCMRNEIQTQANVTGLAANALLLNMQKQKTTNMLVKTGQILAGTTTGVTVFSALSDVMLDRTQIIVDNKPIRNNLRNLVAKESVGYNFRTVEPQGYLPFSFIDQSGTSLSAFRADDPNVVGGSSQFQLMTDVIAANAANQANLVQEVIIANLGDPAWAGLR